MSQACPYCGNLDFEEEDGLLVCTSCGRQQEGGLQVVDDDAEFGTQGKLNRMKVERQKVKVTKIYRGARAYKLYLQAWQHIMWRQSYVLIHGSNKAPSQLWTVARDLWALKLSTLTSRLDGQTKATSEEDGTDTAVDEDTSDTEGIHAGEPSKKSLNPRLWDTISLVYLAALLIRYPIPLSRIYDLIRSEELPFIRAVRFVPYEMSSHLPSEYQLALDTTTIPERHELQKLTYHFIQSFSSTFDMEVPALNWRILLYERIIELGLPLEVYNTVKALSKFLDYDFTYQFPGRTPLTSDKDTKKRSRRTPVAMPEFQLMSLVVVATKLLFPFPIPTSSDPKSQGPGPHSSATNLPSSSLTDLSLDWSTWHNLHKAHMHPKTPAQKHIETTDKDIFEMSSEEIDDYMSWYQRTFTTPDSVLRQKKTDLEMSILDMFPAPSPPTVANPASNAPDTERPTDIDATLCKQIQTSALSYNANSRPANQAQTYPVFSSVEALQATNYFFKGNDAEATDTDNPIFLFYELAAKLACTDLKVLIKAVRYTESRMEKWIERRYRERISKGTGEEEGEPEEEEDE